MLVACLVGCSIFTGTGTGTALHQHEQSTAGTEGSVGRLGSFAAKTPMSCGFFSVDAFGVTCRLDADVRSPVGAKQ